MPEHFQCRIVEGAIVHVDHVLVYGKTQEEHDARLHAVLKKIESAGGPLNKVKCEFSKELLTFLGQVIGKEGVSSDPEKTRTIVEMEAPKNLKELRRFMGMVNYNQLGKFSPNLAECSQPLCELLSPRKAWLWGPAQEEAFKVKEELTRPTVLALYDPNTKTKEDQSCCVRIWTRCCPIAESRERGVEINRICLQVSDQDQNMLITDRERDPCSCLGV